MTTKQQFKRAYAEVRIGAHKFRTPPLFDYRAQIAVAAIASMRNRQLSATTCVQLARRMPNFTNAVRFFLRNARERCSA